MSSFDQARQLVRRHQRDAFATAPAYENDLAILNGLAAKLREIGSAFEFR